MSLLSIVVVSLSYVYDYVYCLLCVCVEFVSALVSCGFCGFGWGGDGCCWWAVVGGWCLASLRVRVRVRVSLCLFVVWCRVMSCVARRSSLFFVCRWSLVVSCRLSFVVLCSVVLCCCVLLLLLLRAFVGYWSVCVCRLRRTCAVLLAGCLRAACRPRHAACCLRAVLNER